MPDLMQHALATLHRVHAAMRTPANKSVAITRLTSRAHEILGIWQALGPLFADEVADIRQVCGGDDGNQPIQILAHMTVDIGHYGRVACLMRDCGLVCHTPAIWKHPDGWVFLAHWPDAAHAHRVIEPDEAAA